MIAPRHPREPARCADCYCRTCHEKASSRGPAPSANALAFETAAQVDLAAVELGEAATLLITGVPGANRYAALRELSGKFPDWTIASRRIDTCGADHGAEILPAVAPYAPGALAGRLVLSMPREGGEFVCYPFELSTHQFDALRGDSAGLSWVQAGAAGPVIVPRIGSLLVTRASRLVGVRPARVHGTLVLANIEFLRS